MTHFPQEEENLVSFLRQHRPEVPTADPDLENQILQQVKSLTRIPERKKRRFWLPALISTGFLATLAGYLILVPRQPSAVELANVEDFIESSWQGAIDQDTGGESWSVLDNLTD
jgi:hypothetical protein